VIDVLEVERLRNEGERAVQAPEQRRDFDGLRDVIECAVRERGAYPLRQFATDKD
jgi:hypothetical protein